MSDTPTQPDYAKFAPTAEAAAATNADTLTQILELGAQLDTLVTEKAAKELELEELGKKIEKIQSDLLPGLMDSMQPPIKLFKLQSGKTIERITIWKGKITDDTKDEAFEWLKATNNDALIKNLIEIQFGMDENTKAELLATMARAAGGTVEHKQSIHAKTLDSFVKKMKEDPEPMAEDAPEFPEAAFGVTEIKRVKIK